MSKTPAAPLPAHPTTAQRVEALQVDISIALRRLGDLAALLEQLLDSHQRGPGFLTFEGRLRRDKLVRQERSDRHFNARAGLPAPAAATPAPGNLSAIDLWADLFATLHHNSRTIARALTAAQAPVELRSLPAEPTAAQMIANLRHLVFNAPSPRLLGQVLRDLETLVSKVTPFVENSRPWLLPDPCPFCGRTSLVKHPAEDLIRCERDPRTGEALCVCPDTTCPCRTDPTGHRHEWRHPAAFGHRSYAIGLIQLIKHTKKETHRMSTPIGLTVDYPTADRILAGYHRELHQAGAIGPTQPTTDLGVHALEAALANLHAGTEAEHHQVVLEFAPGQGVTVSFECTAPEGSDCRLAPRCMVADDGKCRDGEGYHSEDCDPDLDRNEVDAGECLVKAWVDLDPTIMGEGRITVPVTTEWTGDDYLFTPAGVTETDR